MMSINIIKYLNRVMTTMKMCCVSEEQRKIINTIQVYLQNPTIKEFTPTNLIFDNKNLIKDTRLAKDYQILMNQIPMKQWQGVDGLYVLNLSSDVFESLPCEMGIILLDCYKSYESKATPLNRDIMILSGTAEWIVGDEVYKNYSAGNMISANREQSLSVIANHTPLLALYIAR